ncbi:MAG: LiaF-related protein [Spirochaetes bacterium]|nr:LiaF-related protein [Spirochaetota bacterium]
MVRWNWVIGIILIVLGAITLMGIFHVFWPLLLIAVGVLIVAGASWRRGEAVREQAAVALDGAQEAAIRVRHGAGKLSIGAGTAPGDLLSGSFGGGLDALKSRDGGRLAVEMRVKDRDVSHFVFPWTRGNIGVLDWDFVFNTAVPLTLALETGASESRLLLTDLQVRELSVSTGASSTIVDLPARAGMTRVRVESGAASVKLRVPAGVAASISIRSALAGIRVDTSRFPKAGDSYRSADYDSAANRVEISVETGVGSIEIN